jgi:hypothetical protein
MGRSLLTRRHPAAHVADPQSAHAGAQLLVAHDQVVLAQSVGERRLTDAPSASLQNPQHAAEGAAGCEIGDAIAILMARYPISYTKAFAAMIASCDRTQRSMPDLAPAVIETHARQPWRGRVNHRPR